MGHQTYLTDGVCNSIPLCCEFLMFIFCFAFLCMVIVKLCNIYCHFKCEITSLDRFT